MKPDFPTILLVFTLIFTLGISPTSADSPNPDQQKTSQNITDMKTIGVIGWISWASSLVYYKLLNEMVHDRLGGDHSADILMYSIEFDSFSQQERLGQNGNWSQLLDVMVVQEEIPGSAYYVG
jgi:hypothetical protein